MFELFEILNAIISAANFLSARIREDAILVGGLVNQSTGFLAGEIGDAESAIRAEIDRSELSVIERIAASELLARQESDRTIAEVVQAIVGALDQDTGQILSGQDRVVSVLTNEILVNRAVMGDLEGSILGELGGIGDVIGELLDVLGDDLGSNLGDLIGTLDVRLGDIAASVIDAIRESIEANEGVLASLIDGLRAGVGELVDQIGSELGELSPELRRIWQAITATGDKANEVAEKVLDRTAEGTGGAATSSVLDELNRRSEATREQLRAGLVDFVERTGRECLTLEEREFMTSIGEELDHWAASAIVWVAEKLRGLTGMLAIAQAVGQDTLSRWSECNPWQRLPPAETVVAFQRGLINADTTQRILQQHGFSADDAERIVNVGFTPPTLDVVYALWLRDEVDDEAFDQMLADLGFPEGMKGPLRQLAFFIPPVQDLITMAVREVFTPEIAAAQGQFEDFPEDFAKFARMQGVSEEWARNYWAAHWSLPSIQMGFEMLHRGVIDEEQLNTLLRALDVMPGWRGPLTRISYAPFTRVDVRRMHALGVLDDSEVKRAYMDLGYDDEKAGLLLDFTKRFNEEEPALTVDIASDLTRASIVGFYVEGVIPREAAFGLLVQAGINVAAAELFLLDADFRIERRERREQLDIILDRFRYAGEPFTQASDQIHALELEPRERDLAILELERLRVQEIKLPSRADLDKFLASRIIDREEYVDQLERQGYSPQWAERYAQLITGR